MIKSPLNKEELRALADQACATHPIKVVKPRHWKITGKPKPPKWWFKINDILKDQKREEREAKNRIY